MSLPIVIALSGLLTSWSGAELVAAADNYATAVCACKDAACKSKAINEFTEASQTLFGEGANKLSGEQNKRFMEAVKKATKCAGMVKETRRQGSSFDEAGEILKPHLVEIARIIEANLKEPDKVVELVRAALKRDAANIKRAIGNVRKKFDQMSPEEQDQAQAELVSVPELINLFEAMERFETQHPEHIGKLEEVIDEYQGAAY